MMNQLSLELKNFIVSFCRKMKIRNIDIEKLDLDTSLDLDLNIFDLDMDVFIDDFIKKFNIDVSTFKWGVRFPYPTEDDMGLPYILFRSFNYKKNWVKRICRKLYKPKLFVKDLQESIERKKLR